MAEIQKLEEERERQLREEVNCKSGLANQCSRTSSVHYKLLFSEGDSDCQNCCVSELDALFLNSLAYNLVTLANKNLRRVT